jgi:hypothetical protein
VPSPSGGLEFASSALTAVGSKLFFSANDGLHGNELWLYNAPAPVSP